MSFTGLMRQREQSEIDRKLRDRRYARAVRIADETGVSDIATHNLLDAMEPTPSPLPADFVDGDCDGQ